jgi:hypothetical protein
MSQIKSTNTQLDLALLVYIIVFFQKMTWFTKLKYFQANQALKLATLLSFWMVWLVLALANHGSLKIYHATK